jgi:RNA polymerase sigma-70 factor (ECF subfamily)
MLLLYPSGVCYNRREDMATISKQQELDLALDAKTGSSESFGRLYEIYIKKIYDFIYYKTLKKEVAEDITSIVFTKAWNKIEQFKEGSFSAWLYMIARNAVTDYYRREKGHDDIEDCWDLADKTDFLANIDNDLSVELIRETMKSLKEQEREILIMRFWLDLSFSEIAERLNKKEGAVKMALGRALKDLKNKVPLAMILLWPEIINICKRIN